MKINNMNNKIQLISREETTSVDMFELLESRRKETAEQIQSVYDRISTVNHELTMAIEKSNDRILDEIKAMSKEQSKHIDSLEEKITNVQHDIELKMKEREEKTSVDINNIEKRVGVLENWKWMIIGGAFVITGLIEMLSGGLELIKKILSF